MSLRTSSELELAQRGRTPAPARATSATGFGAGFFTDSLQLRPEFVGARPDGPKRSVALGEVQTRACSSSTLLDKTRERPSRIPRATGASGASIASTRPMRSSRSSLQSKSVVHAVMGPPRATTAFGTDVVPTEGFFDSLNKKKKPKDSSMTDDAKATPKEKPKSFIDTARERASAKFDKVKREAGAALSYAKGGDPVDRAKHRAAFSFDYTVMGKNRTKQSRLGKKIEVKYDVDLKNADDTANEAFAIMVATVDKKVQMVGAAMKLVRDLSNGDIGNFPEDTMKLKEFNAIFFKGKTHSKDVEAALHYILGPEADDKLPATILHTIASAQDVKLADNTPIPQAGKRSLLLGHSMTPKQPGARTPHVPHDPPTKVYSHLPVRGFVSLTSASFGEQVWC